MSSCNQKHLVVEYFFNELTIDRKAQYESHLGQCELCQQHLDELKGTSKVVKRFQRQQPDKKFLKNYHRQLKEQFFPEKKKTHVFENVIDIFIRRPSIAIRIAEAVALLVLGIFIGRNFVWQSEFSQTPLSQYQNNYQILNEDLLLKNYLQETEMVLLDVSNLDPIEDQKIIFNLIQSTKYRYLLQKTAMLKNQAYELEDQQLIGLLNRVELILLELSNLGEQPSPATIDEIKQQLKKSYLLMEIKSIKHHEI
ncbi:MAG TPA: hypothetical protein VGD14_10855 [bacterium]